MPNGQLLSLAAALRAAGAAIPTQQAVPMIKNDLLEWAAAQKDCRTWLVAWKTASRWAEVAALTRSQFIHVTEDEIIIDWFTTPKGKRANPFSPSRWAVIQGSLAEGIFDLLQGMGHFESLHPWGTSSLVKEFSMKQYTAHSIKRGAISHLMQVLAEGHPIPEELISRLAKHKTISPLSDVTLRYGGDQVAMARASKFHLGNLPPKLSTKQKPPSAGFEPSTAILSDRRSIN